MLRGEAVATGHHRVTTRLVVRESCGCPGPLAVAAARVADSEQLLDGVRRLLGGAPAPDLETSVKHLAALLHDVAARPKPVDGTELRRILQPIGRRIEQYETVVAVMRTIREFARDLPGAGDDAAQRRVDDALYQTFVVLAQAQSAYQAGFHRSTMLALGTQYAVSLQLLRSQERDPRSLEWLRTTDVRGGCLGLWPADPARRGRYLDVISTFDRRDRTTAGGGEIEIERFPPAEIIDMAENTADDMVYLAHLKVGAGDWGILAMVGPIEAEQAEGRETMNQWAALLSVALEHDAVLRTLREREDGLRRAALYDDLTGLPNRSHFRDRLTAAMTRARHRPCFRYAVLLLDLDGFKVVNDSLGHEVGDRLLQAVARQLTEQLRTDDLAARLGGDEFAVLIEEFAGSEVPVELAERLQAAVSAPCRLADTDVAVTASIGIAFGNDGYTDTQDVMRDADAAMYYAKGAGKRRHAVFTPAMHTSAVDRLRTGAELRHAIEHDELELFYQPIIALDTGAVSGVEALVRWRHPTRGLLAPAAFLPLAEESDIGLQIGAFVLHTAARQAVTWRRDLTGAGFRISVNVSNRQFWHGQLLDAIRGLVAGDGLDPAGLALEITEGVIMHDARHATQILTSLNRMGVEVHIDDFGTGYSSLEALHDLHFDALKIDRSFTSRLTAGTRSRELVRTIVAMGLNLGLKVIAEGIETTAELAVVRELGCTHGQGYLYLPPVPADTMTGYLTAPAEDRGAPALDASRELHT
jgi:diguanylate cyclase (GGDEF)-like protein